MRTEGGNCLSGLQKVAAATEAKVTEAKAVLAATEALVGEVLDNHSNFLMCTSFGHQRGIGMIRAGQPSDPHKMWRCAKSRPQAYQVATTCHCRKQRTCKTYLLALPSQCSSREH